MRICRIFNTLPSSRNPGAGLVPYYFARYVEEPTLFVTRRTEGALPLPPHVRLVAVDTPDSTTPAGLRERLFGEQPTGRAARLLLQVQLAVRAVRGNTRFLAVAVREMLRFRPELVVCHSLKRLGYGVLAKLLLGSRLVLSLHNTTEAAALKNLPLLRWLIRLADRVVVVSAEIGRQLAPFVPRERIWVSSTGVDLAVFSDQHLPREPQLVAIGSFKWKKGYPDLLEAARIVFQRFPDHRLVIVGDGEERPAIAAAVERLGLASRVVLTGVLPHPEVVRLLNTSRVFVMASLHEGLPKVLLEALACGTPAVVTDACNAEGIIDTTGLSVPPRDPGALAGAIVRLLTEPDLWERCSRNGPAVAAQYDWKAVVERDYRMYRELSAPPARPRPLAAGPREPVGNEAPGHRAG